jgi:hypothetical protein
VSGTAQEICDLLAVGAKAVAPDACEDEQCQAVDLQSGIVGLSKGPFLHVQQRSALLELLALISQEAGLQHQLM